MQLQSYAIKVTFFKTCATFFLVRVKAKRGKGGRRILLFDNRGTKWSFQLAPDLQDRNYCIRRGGPVLTALLPCWKQACSAIPQNS